METSQMKTLRKGFAKLFKPNKIKLKLPSKEEARAWGDSFEKLLDNDFGRDLFKKFLKSEYSEDNLLFWEACMALKEETDEAAIHEEAKLIYKKYISLTSPNEVNINANIRRKIDSNIHAPTLNIFDEAKAWIGLLMETDSFPRFIKSNLFKSFISSHFSEDSDSSK